MQMPLALTAALLIAACSADGPVSAGRLKKVPSGEWGGEHVRLTVTDTQGSIEFDCGHGTLDGPLTLDGQGRFDVQGTYVREGGPVREGEEQKQKARYSGTSDAKTMALTLALEGGEPSGPFQLALGQPARLRKCLAASAPAASRTRPPQDGSQ
jgi:hypothetical protein